MTETAQSYRRRVETLIDAYQTVDNMRAATHHISGLNRSNKIGDKLIKAGIALVAFPEPIVTEAFGTILMGAGLFVKRRSSRATLNDLKTEVTGSYQQIKKLTEEVKL